MKAKAIILISPQKAYNVARSMRGKLLKRITPEVWSRFLRSEHSPIRVATYKVTVTDLSYYSSVHLSRHKLGVEHFITSNRPDIAGKARSVGDTVTHVMVINAQALISMARKRLCYNAAKDTREAMEEIGLAIYGIDKPLAEAMMPDCMYRGRCGEMVCCGRIGGEVVG